MLEGTLSKICVVTVLMLVGIVNSLRETVIGEEDLLVEGELDYYPYEKFSEIKYPKKFLITGLTLKKVEFEPAQLTAQLRSLNLSALMFTDVVWEGKFLEKLELPNLDFVRITRKKWSFSDSFSKDFWDSTFFFTSTNMDKMYISVNAELGGSFSYHDQELYPYDIPYDIQQYFNYTKLYALRTELDVSKFRGVGVKDITIKSSVHRNGTSTNLFQKLSGQPVTRLILDQVTFENSSSSYDLSFLDTSLLEKMLFEDASLIYATNPIVLPKLNEIEFVNSPVNTSGMTFSKSLVEVIIKNSMFPASLFGLDVMHCQTKLEMVLLHGPEVGPKMTFDMSLLRMSEDTLEDLTLTNFSITISSDFQFKKLNELTIGSCELDTNMLQNFSFVFNKVPKMILYEVLNDSLLPQVLNTSVSNLYTQVSKGDTFGNENVEEFFDQAGAPKFAKFWKLIKKNDTWHYSGQISPKNNELTRKWFYTYVGTVFAVCIFGIVGNIVSIAVLLRKPMMTSTSCIMIALGLFDFTILLTLAASLPLFGFKLVSQFLGIYHFQFLTTSATEISLLGKNPLKTAVFLEEILSNYIYPLTKTAYSGSVYVTILLTLERFAAVCYPLKIHNWTSKRKATVMCTVILFAAVVMNLPRWFENAGSTIRNQMTEFKDDIFYSTLVRDYNRPNILQQRMYRRLYHGYMWTFLMYGIPIPLLIYLNTRILIKVRRATAKRGSLSSQPDRSGDTTALTAMLLCVSICFVLCNIANGSIIWIFVSFGNYDPRDIEVFSSIPIIINSSTNFVFYFLLGKKFRAELALLLRNYSCTKN